MRFILFVISITILITLNACGSNSFSESDAINLTLAKIQVLNEPHLKDVDFPKRVGTKIKKVVRLEPPGTKAKLNSELITRVVMINRDT